MEQIELHIIHTVPSSCLNRDDTNTPKDCIVGGTKRGRISSQCWKRPIRMQCKEKLPNVFGGVRTRLVGPLIEEALIKMGKSPMDAKVDAKKMLGQLVEKKENKKVKVKEINGKVKPENNGETIEIDEVSEGRIKTILFITPAEIEAMVKAWIDNKQEKGKKNSFDKALASVHLHDGADIALFGRMIEQEFKVKVEAACSFAHAFSTHKTETEMDFFTAVDDNKSEVGAAITDSLMFQSNTHYRYININIDQLKENLGNPTPVELKNILEVFIESCITAMPTAKQTTMSAQTRPDYVLGLYKKQGSPLQLSGAFTKAIKSEDIVKDSIKALKERRQKEVEIWGDKSEVEAEIGENEGSLKELVSKLTKPINK